MTHRSATALKRRWIAVVAITLVACGGGENYYTAGPRQLAPPGCLAGSETLTIVSGNGQTGAPGALLPERATVKLTCDSVANPGTTIPAVGALVEWSPLWGLVDGTSFTATRTDNTGTTSVTWKLAANFAQKRVQATHVTPLGLISQVDFDAATTATTTTATTCQDAGGTDHGTLGVSDVDVAWTAAGSPHRGGTFRLDNFARLSIEAGAVVCLDEIAGFVTAEGTAQAPIRFFGTSMSIYPVLSHVVVENALKIGSVTRPAWSIADATLRWTSARDPLACAQVAGSSLLRVQISGYGSQECAALHLAAIPDPYYVATATVSARILDSVGDGVLLAGSLADFSFTDCEIASSMRHGIVVPVPASGFSAPNSVLVQGCNLFGNGGNAIHNQSTTKVTASGNWWGDPAGPSGANGDGIFGDVDAGSPSATALTLGW